VQRNVQEEWDDGDYAAFSEKERDIKNDCIFKCGEQCGLKPFDIPCTDMPQITGQLQ
jgi:hypothetical protein